MLLAVLEKFQDFKLVDKIVTKSDLELAKHGQSTFKSDMSLQVAV